jgi:EAL domain-containing protein (putative c-di-GMP-specific phosphodiesterase class I)
MREALPAAIQNSELFALYQPQVSVNGRCIVAVEALLRWDRPGVGVVLPAHFLPYAEDNDLIDPIGTFMLERACRDAAHWGGIRVAINVSQKQFARPELADFICTIALAHGVNLRDLEIEVTETAAFPHFAEAVAQLKILRARGVTISLDDLGSGNATKDLMASLPLDRVKLGKEVVELCTTTFGKARLADLIGAAHLLGLGVTAEGIETKIECDILRDLGCDQMQGFFFSQPMPAGELLAFIAQSDAKWRA